jgi:hypothetical protein
MSDDVLLCLNLTNKSTSTSLISGLDISLFADGVFDSTSVLRITLTEQLIPEKPEGSNAPCDSEYGQNPVHQTSPCE